MTDLPFTIHRDRGSIVRLLLCGDLDRSAHGDLRRALREVFTRTRGVTVSIDMGEVDAIGGECIELLLLAYTRALRSGHGFEIVNAYGLVRQNLELTGLCARLPDGEPLYAPPWLTDDVLADLV
ncbi:MAG TPA: STAS domain-containing protein [Actinoplanes sp.]|jgi:anti-anti-sigma factor